MKKNGFIFMETIVVVSVLSITLLLLFTSYSYLLRKARERNVFNTTDTIYKAYNVRESLISTFNGVDSTGSINDFIKEKCKPSSGNVFYKCDTNDTSESLISQTFKSLRESYGLEKLYLVHNTTELEGRTILLEFDATTIDFIRSSERDTGENTWKAIMKFKKCYNKLESIDTCEDYEVFHTMIDLENGYASEK